MVYELPPQGEKKEQQKERIKEIVQDTRDSRELYNCVYVLKCKNPNNKSELKEMKNEAGLSSEISHKYVNALVAEETSYIGWSNQPVNRILSHLRAEPEGARFTKLYKPQAVREIRWYDTKGQAKEAEDKVANEYNEFWTDDFQVDLESLSARNEELEWTDIVESIKGYNHPDHHAYSF